MSNRVTPYEKTNWADNPSHTSPINDVNLNHIETGIKNVTDAVNDIPEVEPLEPATANKLGGIKVGSGLSVTQDGTLSANAQSLSPATANDLGGVKVGSGLSVTQDGTLSANSQPLSPATENDLGGIKVGSGLSIAQDGTLSADGGETYTLPTATYNVKGGVKISTTGGLDMVGTNNEYISVKTGQGISKDSGTGAITLNEAGSNTLGGVRIGSGLTKEYKSGRDYLAIGKATQSALGGVIVGDGLYIANDGTLSASLSSLDGVDISSPTDGQVLVYDATSQEWVNGNPSVVEELTYQETMNILNPTYLKRNIFTTDDTITGSGPWSSNPQSFVFDGETGSVTFSNTGIANVPSWHIKGSELSGVTIPIGSKIVFDGDSDGLYWQYHGQALVLDENDCVTANLVGWDLHLYINVENGKTYNIDCIPQVWIPQ